MRPEDLPEVMAIEKASFPTPFTENLFRMEMNLDVAHLYVIKGERMSAGRLPSEANGETAAEQMGGAGRRVVSPPAVTEDAVRGYIDFWLVGPEIHLITIAVHPEFRRKGLGERLLSFMMEEAGSHAVEGISLDVRPSNQVARALYEKFGFRETGLRKRYYQDNNEDALVMTWQKS